jgi:hypothetical protein
MLGGMFSFMKKTSRVRHNPESEGIYLSDLNADELDPEVAALYFPSSHRNPGGNATKGINFAIALEFQENQILLLTLTQLCLPRHYTTANPIRQSLFFPFLLLLLLLLLFI